MPNIVNFGGQFQPPAQQQLSQSQILGQLLAQQQGQPGQSQQPDPFAGLQQAVMQKGMRDAMLKNQQQQQVANQIGQNFLQNQIIPRG